YPGEKPPALARNRARPGGKGFGRGFHRARDIFGATPRHLGDWAPVRRIFNFEPLTRSAVDPFTADQHAFFLKCGLVFAYFADSRLCPLHRCFCGPASSATTLKATSCSRARWIDRVESSYEASADVGCPSLGFSLTDSLGLRRQLKNRRLLTLIQECQEHNPA